MYTLNKDADINGTSLKGEFYAKFSDLENLFGLPEESDGYKVSGEWVFTHDETGEVFTVYDWKETELYDEDLPSVLKFRRSKVKHCFHVGGRTYAGDFIDWLNSQLKAQS